jgi:hypothetical protein
MAFQQGIVLDKHGVGSHGGRRIVRLNGDYLEWSKLNKQVWQPERELLKSHITGICMASQVHPAAFRVESQVRDPVTFIAVSVDSCRKIVHALQTWASSKLTPYHGLRRGSAPAGPGYGTAALRDDTTLSTTSGALVGRSTGGRAAWMPPPEPATNAPAHMTTGAALVNGTAGGRGEQGSANQQPMQRLSWNRQQDLQRITEKKEQMSTSSQSSGEGQRSRKALSRFRAAAMAINVAASSGLAKSKGKLRGGNVAGGGQQGSVGGVGNRPGPVTRDDSWDPNNLQRQSVNTLTGMQDGPSAGTNDAAIRGLYDQPVRSGLM